MPTPTRSARPAGVRAILGSSLWSLGLAARTSPAWLALTVVTAVVLALVPAAQVRAVAWLVGSAEGGLGSALAPLLLLTLLVGAGQMISSAENLVAQRNSLRLMDRLNARIARTAARLAPQQIADSRIHALLDGSWGSTWNISRGPGAVIGSLSALLAALALGAAVWPFSALAAILVVLALVPSLINFAWGAGMQDARFEEESKHGARFRYLLEQLVGSRTATELATLGTGAKIADRAESAHARFVGISDRIYAALLRGDLIGGAVTAVLLGGALVAVLAAGSGAPGLTAGVLGVIAGLQATRSAGFAFGDVISVAPRIARFRELEALPVASAPQDVEADVQRLEVRDVDVTYPGAPEPAVRSANLYAERGEMIALVGVNGAGKTTLVGALLGLLDIAGGRIAVDGADASALDRAARFSRFGLVIQEFGRYELTVRDAVALGSPREDIDDAEIWAALDAARARPLVERLPHGLDTMLGTQFDGVGLSGGQWQRIALARIHLRGAAIRILDEPTSAIDAEAEQEVFAQLRDTAADRITIVVSHRAWTLRGMDRIYVMEGGQIVERGGFEELVSGRTRFAAIFAGQLT